MLFYSLKIKVFLSSEQNAVRVVQSECKLLQSCSHRTWLNCRLVTTKRSERTLKYIYVYISRHYAGGPVGPAAKVTLRAVHQLYESNATIISITITWNYLRYLRLHRFLIATGGAIRHIDTRSYMDWQFRQSSLSGSVAVWTISNISFLNSDWPNPPHMSFNPKKIWAHVLYIGYRI